MANIVGAVALSHSPFWDLSLPPPGPGHAFVTGLAGLRERVAALRPDAVVVFGPDHFRNFFYDVLPAFCIGVERIFGFGDYGMPRGALPAASALGKAIHRGVSSLGFDPAISYRMGVDHGIVQPYEVFFSGADLPMVPIMINANGAPRPGFARCHDFGRAVGETIRDDGTDARVLLLASGGMSHWVAQMSADHPDLTSEMRDYVIGGRERAAKNSAARDASLLARAKKGVDGRVNAKWDRWVLSAFHAGDAVALTALSDEAVEEAGGNGAHELRAWVAVLGAWAKPLPTIVYEPVTSWVTGMGCVAALQED